jgi:signal transduction histidine kinase
MRDDEVAHAIFRVLRRWLDGDGLAVAGRSPQDLVAALRAVPGFVSVELRSGDADPVDGGHAWPVRAGLSLDVVPAATGCAAEALGCAAALLGAALQEPPTTHALRGPLTPILAYAELLGESAFGPLNPAQRKAVAAIERNALRLSELLTESAARSERP